MPHIKGIHVTLRKLLPMWILNYRYITYLKFFLKPKLFRELTSGHIISIPSANLKNYLKAAGQLYEQKIVFQNIFSNLWPTKKSYVLIQKNFVLDFHNGFHEISFHIELQKFETEKAINFGILFFKSGHTVRYFGHV